MTDRLSKALLYGILDTGYIAAADAIPTARLMLEGGVGVLQLRAKNLAPSEISPLARSLAPLCESAGVPLILNDHPALVAETGAHGAHVGQDDMPVSEARRLAGPEKIIGLSTHSAAQAAAAVGQHPDYIGFGPLFSTLTKPDYTAIGLEDVRAVHTSAPFPVFCIGGIKLHNLPEVLSAGARRAVIVSGILQSADIPAYCRSCLALLRAA
jgi:thiamine-phosphate pyrophosphorylase